MQLGVYEGLVDVGEGAWLAGPMMRSVDPYGCIVVQWQLVAVAAYGTL